MSDTEKLAEKLWDMVHYHGSVSDVEKVLLEWQAARQAPASGEVEPVMELDISEDRCFSPNLIDETLSLPAGHYKLYTHPPAKVPEGWKVWETNGSVGNDMIVQHPDGKPRRFFNRQNEPLMFEFLRKLLTTPTPATTPETEWVKCEDRLPTEADADENECVWTSNSRGYVIYQHWTNVRIDDLAWKPTGLKRPAPPQEQ